MLNENFDFARNNANKQLIEETYRFENKQIPFIVNNVNYWLDGENPLSVPDNYFSNPASMMKYQIEKIRWHKENIDDNYIPVLHPWYGTTVVPSALGVEVVYPPYADPALKGHIITSPDQIKNLCKPDPYKDGLMPRVLSTIDFMKQECDIDICVTDTQGPLNVAISLAGVENIFTWFFTNPAEVHQLMDFAADVIIDWVKVQKQHIGIDIDKVAYPHAIYLPKGGVAISDDDCTQIDDSLYREFVVPYNSKVLKAFGGGSVHFCGTAMHQIKALASTEGLTAVNNFCMGNFEQIYYMQEVLREKKIALMVCDFAPLNIEKYYDDLLSKLKPEGTIISSFPVYSVGLKDGNYLFEKRDPNQLAYKIHNYLKSKLR